MFPPRTSLDLLIVCAEQGHGYSGSLRFRTYLFQVRPDDPTEPLLTFLLCLDTHKGILMLFEEIFGDAVDRPRWEVRRNAVEATWIVQRDRFRQIIDRVKGAARRQVAFHLVTP